MELWVWFIIGYAAIGIVGAAIMTTDNDKGFAAFAAFMWPIMLTGWLLGSAALGLRNFVRRIVR